MFSAGLPNRLTARTVQLTASPSAGAGLRAASSGSTTTRARFLSASAYSLSSSPFLRCPSLAAAQSRRRPAVPSSSIRALTTTPTRFRAAPAEEPFDLSKVERVADEVDVCIVGAGPAGLSAAIRIKQRAQEAGKEIRVVVLEKGAEVGSHILSGAVIETRALDELIPNWKELGAPLNQPATRDAMRFLTSTSSFPIPHPPQMTNKGNYIISLSRFTSWLGERAEELGVELYPGFAGASVLWREDGKGVRGIVTNDIGLDKERRPKDTFEPGMEFHARLTLFAEGAHGSLTKEVSNRLGLREAAGADPQTYGLGVKEVWKVKKEKHEPGLVAHTLGWPLNMDTYGGSWMYHMEDDMVSIGLVIGLDYTNPYLSPFREFQRMKHHPFFASVLEGGECLAYGARALNEGGYQSIPKLHFPGGALVGCAAGFLNVPKIKGTHNAMKSGMLAADAAIDHFLASEDASAVGEGASLDELASVDGTEGIDLASYKDKLDGSWVMDELKEVRNLRPSFHNPLGLYGGVLYSGIDSLLLKGRTPWTFHHKTEDYAATKRAAECQPIEYPAPDGKLSFDILTSVSRTNTNHAENQPVHLVVKNGDSKRHTDVNVGEYAGLLGSVCPAAVYEYVDSEDAGGVEDARGKKFVINSQNCIHCKTCSIKTPTQDITWTVPEGGGGPKYSLT